MSRIAPDGRESRWVLVCQGNNPEILCAKLFVLFIGRTETSVTFYLVSTLLEASSWWDPSQNSSASISGRVNNFYTERKKKKKSHFPSPSLHAGKEGRTPGFASGPNLLPYSTGMGREALCL